MYTRLLCPMRGDAKLITGNFTYFTRFEAKAITDSLKRSNTLVMLFDRDYITTPANERATWIRRYFKYDPSLEVRVVYGAPAINPENAISLANFLQKRIPDSVKVHAICCEQPYSQYLAQCLNATYHPTLRFAELLELEATFRKKGTDAREILTDISASRVVDAFKSLADETQFKQLLEHEKKSIKQFILKNNSDHPNANSFFSRTRWDTRQLNRINLPVIIGAVSTLENQAAFSNPYQCQVFDMPIYMPDQGWRIPSEFTPIMPVIAKITAAETVANPSIANCNVYITIDAGLVPPNAYARREGLHVDGFLTNANTLPTKDGIIWGDNTYIVSDAPELQTELYPGPFDLSHVDNDDARDVLRAFSNQGKNMAYQQARAYEIVKLTTNNVHAVHPNSTKYNIQRSFLKMTFSERLFNRGGNTINPHLNYRLVYVPRTTERNTQNFIGILPLGYEEGNLDDFDLAVNKFPSWVNTKPFIACKNPHVQLTATPTIEGETLTTVVNDQVVTTNIARNGDMKITRIDGDSYFLSKEKFNQLYKKKEGTENVYTPTKRHVKAVKINRHLSFLASWGTRQNIPSGSFIIQDEHNEKWGVHEHSFNATYLRGHCCRKINSC